jgi:hypothetical protein
MKFFHLFIHNDLVLTTIMAQEVIMVIEDRQLETGEYSVSTSYQPS